MYGCLPQSHLCLVLPRPPSPANKLQYQAISTSTVARWEWSVSNPASGTIAPDGTLPAAQPGAFQVRACASIVLSGWNWLAIDSATATINDNGILTGRRAGVTVVMACAISQPHDRASAEVYVQ